MKGASIALTVEQAGMKMTVKAGSFTLDGEEKSLAEDEEYTVGQRAEDTTVAAFLVEDTSDGSYHVLVDEFIHDGIDEKYVFARGGQYKLIERIYDMEVPGGTTTLDDIDVRLKTTVEYTPPQPQE
jgi:hypothetical protein